MSDGFTKEEAEAYFNRQIQMDAGKPALPLMPRPCHDCAVTCGFYKPYTDGLALLPKGAQLQASKRWFCHNHCGRACRGNADQLGIDWTVGPAGVSP